VVKEINEPRLPSLKGKMAAKKAEIIQWKAADLNCDADHLGLNGSPTKVVKIFNPPPRGGGEVFTGEPAEIAAKLVEKLKDAVIAAGV
jgi:electron transfer flavoprotein beta subunit